MDWFVEVFIDKVTFMGVNFCESVMDFVADRLGEFCAFFVSVILLPVTLLLMFLGVGFTFVFIVSAVILSPIILPVSIYRHLKSKRN